MWGWVFIFYCITIFLVNYFIRFVPYLKNLDNILECLTIESRKKRSLFYDITKDMNIDYIEDHSDSRNDIILFLKRIFKESFYRGVPIFYKIEWLKKFFYEYKKGLKDKIIFIEAVKKKIYLSIIGCFCIRAFFVYEFKLNTTSDRIINYNIGGVEDLLLNISGVCLIISLVVIINKNFNRKIILSKYNLEKLENFIEYYIYGSYCLEKYLNFSLSLKNIDISLLDKKDILDLSTKDFLYSLNSILSYLKIKEIKEGISYTKEIENYIENKLNDFMSKENSNFLSFLELFPIIELFFIGGAVFFFLSIPIFSII